MAERDRDRPENTRKHMTAWATRSMRKGERRRLWHTGAPRSSSNRTTAQALRRAAWALATSPDAAIRNGTEALQFAVRAVELSAEKMRGCSTRWPPPTPKRANSPTPR